MSLPLGNEFVEFELAGLLVHEGVENRRIKGDEGRLFVLGKVVRNVNAKFEDCTTVVARADEDDAEPDERRLGRGDYVDAGVRPVFLNLASDL